MWNYEILAGNDIEVEAAERDTYSGTNGDLLAAPFLWGDEGGTLNLANATTPLPVDTELPPAIPLADFTANPTAPRWGFCAAGWSAATWDRSRYTTAAGWDIKLKTGSIAAAAKYGLIYTATITNTVSDSGSLDVTGVGRLLLTVAAAAFYAVDIWFDLLGADGIWYNIYDTGAIAATNSLVLVQSFGSGTAHAYPLTSTCRVRWNVNNVATTLSLTAH